MTALGMTFHSIVAQPITAYVKAKSAVGCASRRRSPSATPRS